ncbi:hypothetical protein [Pararhizobium qamdonense]|uniref:hypothetical protein n=1 Tax=Pararhizobium qamdonense TaxID=3031126 RepID=UPI0023E2F941|nr:hypothetical protein [Pararhizobium qamdonense]
MKDEFDGKIPFIDLSDVKDWSSIIEAKLVPIHSFDLNKIKTGKDVVEAISLYEAMNIKYADATSKIELPGLEVALAIEAANLGVSKKKRKIHRPPGYTLSGIMRFVLPKKMYERVIGQMIIDAREEYTEALANGEKRHAKWIAVRLNLMVAVALLTKLSMMPFEKFAQFMQKD